MGLDGRIERITSKSMNENREHILSFDSTTINRGYDCSTCDPFLLLISELFEVDISHDYNGNIISYKSILNNTGRCFKFKSDRGHRKNIIYIYMDLKIALCFLTYDNLSRPDLWKDFLNQILIIMYTFIIKIILRDILDNIVLII